jgi:glycerol-3-phosphate acyltransferase PlsX
MMGAILASTESGKLPRVGLLNIGSEEYKGTEHIKAAGMALEKLDNLNYTGFIEANRIYAGDADVIVCDGFTGNVTIKTSAGVVNLIEEQLRQTIKSSPWNRLLGLLAKPLLRGLQQSMDPARFNGASILGLQGIIIKSHGNAGVSGFKTAIQQADREITANVHERITAHVADYKRDF